MATMTQFRNQNPLLRQKSQTSVPSPHPTVDPKTSLPVGQSAQRRTLIPAIYLEVERAPISTYDDNPIFNEHGAAAFLGLRSETLKKWRQRDQGPDYIQYGKAGPVRYELNTLTAFRAAHRVQVGV